MGKLKDIRFEAMILEGEKLDKDTLKPSIADNFQKNIRQQPDKARTIYPDKHLEKTKTETDFEEIFTTCKTNYGKGNHGKKDTRVPIHTSNTLSNTWLNDCDDYF